MEQVTVFRPGHPTYTVGYWIIVVIVIGLIVHLIVDSHGGLQYVRHEKLLVREKRLIDNEFVRLE